LQNTLGKLYHGLKVSGKSKQAQSNSNISAGKDKMPSIKLTILGSMGWIPVRNRHTCCYCLEYQETLIVFDAGTGMARFDEPWGKEILNRYDKILLLLSHYHLDHTAGLIYISHFFKDEEVHIAGPGESIYGKSAKDILTNLITPPYFGRPLLEFPMKLTCHDLGVGSIKINGITIDTILQEHSDPSLGIKIDNKVCYLTDTVCTESTADFARNCRLLLHETWFDTQDYRELLRQSKSTSLSPQARQELKSHSSINQVAAAALRAPVEQLVLIHLNPLYDENRLLAMERDAQEIFPNSLLAKDGHTILLEQ
jgi:ribonuclease BN (tRNA processing enzyme)